MKVQSVVIMSCTSSPESDVASAAYFQYYSRDMSSYSSYTTLFPDCSQLNFEDIESETEDSDSSSVFDQDDLATKVEILEIKLDLMHAERQREKEEMLRLHQAMVGMVTDLVKLVSPTNSPLLSPDSPPLKPVVMDMCPITDYSLLEPSLHLPGRQEELHLSGKVEPPHLPTKEAAAKQENSHPRHSDDTARKQQQQEHIDKLVAYIDERAAHYYRSRPTSIQERYPKVDWGRINPYTKRNLPKPSDLPVYGCPQDPNIYPDSPNPDGRVMQLYTITTQCFLPECNHTVCLPPEASTTTYSPSCTLGFFNAITRNEEDRIVLNKAYKPLESTTSPFGTAAGFETSLGIVAPPTSPVGGYVYTEKGWILHATPG